MCGAEYFFKGVANLFSDVARRETKKRGARADKNIISFFLMSAGGINSIKDSAPYSVSPRRAFFFLFPCYGSKSANREAGVRPPHYEMGASRCFGFFFPRVKPRHGKAKLFCQHHTAIFLLPFRLLRFRVFLPPAVRLLLIKPCVRFLFLLLRCADVLSI